jgi:hypothetical protein
MWPRNEKDCILFSKAGSNVVESAAILMEFVWKELGSRAVLLRAEPRS